MDDLENNKKILLNFSLYIFTFLIVSVYGMTHALAYDFSNWDGSVVNKFVFKLSNNSWATTSSNTPKIWLFQPDFAGSPTADIKQVGAELGGFSKQISSGSSTFQFALGYNDGLLDYNTTACDWFKNFNSYTLEYSTNNANSWTNFSVSSLTCSQNNGFIVLNYLVNTNNNLTITNLSFSGSGDNSRSNVISTVFTGFNYISSSNSNGIIINQNNEIINQQQSINNKLDEQNETSKGIFGKIKELFSWLTNPESADISGAADVAGWLPAGPLDSLINLPLTMLNNINTSLGKTCSPLNVNLPYVNKSVEIPCLNTIFNQITGLNSFWTWVGMIGSVLILYRYLINLYNYYDKLTDLQANFISDWGSI